MANRVTVEEVKEIFSTTISADKISACITTANQVVTNGPATSASPNPVLTADELKECERWLAAHFANIQDPIALREKIGDSDAWNFPASVTVAWGRGLSLTPYGQMAIAIDRTGKLASLGLRKASFRAAPREDSDAYTENLTKS